MSKSKIATKGVALGTAGVLVALSGANVVSAHNNIEENISRSSNYLTAKQFIDEDSIFTTSEKQSEYMLNELKDDDIVCYIDGMGVKKKNISEHGEINLEEVRKDPDNINNSMSMYKSVNLPSGKKTAELIKILNESRFTQQTNDYYLTLAQSKDLAKKFEATPWSVAKSGAVSYLVSKFCSGTVSGALTVAQLVSGIQKASIANKIRSFTDKNVAIRYRVMRTSYGYFYAVDSWNGKTIDEKVVQGKEKIVHKEYK